MKCFSLSKSWINIRMENSQWEELNHQVCNKYCNVFVTTCHVQETSQNVKPLSVIFQFQLQIHWSLRFHLRYKNKYMVNIVVVEVEIYIRSNLWLSFDLRFVITLWYLQALQCRNLSFNRIIFSKWEFLIY